MSHSHQGDIDGPEKVSPQRQHIRFLRSLAELDTLLGPWRPDYGNLKAPRDRGSPPPADGEVAGAQQRYASILVYFHTHPDALQALGEARAADVCAAIADARDRPETAEEASRPAIARAQTEPRSRAHAEGGRIQSTQTAPHGQAVPTAPPPAVHRRLAVWMGAIALVAVLALVAGFLLLTAALRGPVQSPGTTRPTPATVPPSAVSDSSPPDVIALARRCSTLAGGAGAPALGDPTSGLAKDPGTGLSTPSISLNLAAAPPAHGPPYTVVVVILPFAATPPPDSDGPAIDRAGTTQLVGYWDGTRWHRGLRTFSAGTWTTVTDLAAAGVNVAFGGTTVTLFWQGLGNGAAFGEVTAGPGGCASHDLSPSLVPTRVYGR